MPNPKGELVHTAERIEAAYNEFDEIAQHLLEGNTTDDAVRLVSKIRAGFAAHVVSGRETANKVVNTLDKISRHLARGGT